MGKIEIFKCDSCDFKFENKDLVFSIDNETKHLEIQTSNHFTSEKIRLSLLNGRIVEVYCSNCHKKLMLFYINIENSEYDRFVLIKFLRKLILLEEKRIKNKLNSIDLNKFNEFNEEDIFEKKYYLDNYNEYEEYYYEKDFLNSINLLTVMGDDFKLTLDAERVLNNECPNCHESLYLINSNNPCPVCGGNIILSKIIMVD